MAPRLSLCLLFLAAAVPCRAGAGEHGLSARVNGVGIGAERLRRLLDEELAKLEAALGPRYDRGRFAEARGLFERLSSADELDEFLTLPAYDRID